MTEHTLFPIHITDDLQIEDYDQLVKDARQIKARYASYIGTARDCRKLKRRINKLSRRLNDLRKTKARPYRSRLKTFKGAIDVLRDYLSDVTNNLNRQLEMYQKRGQQKVLSEYRPVWNHLCKTDGVKACSVPEDILKRKSYSKEKRLKILHADAEQLKRQSELKHAAVVHGKPVTADANGEIRPLENAEARTVTFIGTHLQWMALRKFVKENGIQLRF